MANMALTAKRLGKGILVAAALAAVLWASSALLEPMTGRTNAVLIWLGVLTLAVYCHQQMAREDLEIELAGLRDDVEQLRERVYGK